MSKVTDNQDGLCGEKYENSFYLDCDHGYYCRTGM